jgi:hypothetical protein
LRVIRDLAVNFQWFVFIQKMNPHKWAERLRFFVHVCMYKLL